MRHDDLGLALLEELMKGRSPRSGRYVVVNDFLKSFLARHPMDLLAVKRTLINMFEEHYIYIPHTTEPNGMNLYRLGDPDSFSTGGVSTLDNTEIFADLRWKGRAFYLDHRQDGILSKREWVGFLIVGVLSVFSTVASVWQLSLMLNSNQAQQVPVQQVLYQLPTEVDAVHRTVHVVTDTIWDTVHLTVPVFLPSEK